MKIGVISDTHMPKMAKQVPKDLVQGLRDVDFIIHAGDWNTLDVFEELKQIAPMDGVAGNTDSEEIVKQFGYNKILIFQSKRIGIVHGHGTKGTTEERALETFKNDHVDCIIFGHSHIPLLKEVNGILLFNPGSPTDKRRQPYFSYGIVEINNTLIARHEFYENKG